MELHLQDGRRDPRPSEEIAEQRRRIIADADTADDPGPDELFKSPPRLRQRDVDHLHPRPGYRRVVNPARGIAFLERHEPLGDREMNEVEVEVVEAKVAEGAFRGGADMPRIVVGVPELRCHPQILAAADAGGEARADPHAGLDLVAVVAGRIEVPVADPQRLLNHPSGVGPVDFPEAEPHGRGRALWSDGELGNGRWHDDLGGAWTATRSLTIAGRECGARRGSRHRRKSVGARARGDRWRRHRLDLAAPSLCTGGTLAAARGRPKNHQAGQEGEPEDDPEAEWHEVRAAGRGCPGPGVQLRSTHPDRWGTLLGLVATGALSHRAS